MPFLFFKCTDISLQIQGQLLLVKECAVQSYLDTVSALGELGI